MTNEFYEICKDNDSNWNIVHTHLLTRVDDPQLLKLLYEERLNHLKWRIEEYEKNIQP